MSSLIPGSCFIQEAMHMCFWVCIRWIGRCGTYSTFRGKFFCDSAALIKNRKI